MTTYVDPSVLTDGPFGCGDGLDASRVAVDAPAVRALEAVLRAEVACPFAMRTHLPEPPRDR